MHKIDHLGIAVKSVAVAKRFYEQLGLSVSAEETVPEEKVNLVMATVGESRLELLEPTSEDSASQNSSLSAAEGCTMWLFRSPISPPWSRG
jgi:catechol 2,3-dioxygenase-like lactoylglutathione lyase family enzyme